MCEWSRSYELFLSFTETNLSISKLFIQVKMNKKIIIGIGIVIIMITGIFFLKGNNTKEITSKVVRLGYCPTMKPIAEKIAGSN